MNLTFKKAKLLVDQISGYVVWMCYYMDYDPPIVDNTLNYYYYRGPLTDGTWDNYLNFELKYDAERNTLLKDPLNNETELDQLRLLRLKCDYVNYIDNRIKVTYEKFRCNNTINFHNDLQNNPKFWIEIFAKKHNCSIQSATRLLNFKIEEYKILQSNLEFIRYSAVDKITSSRTIKEVEDHYRDISSLLGTTINAKGQDNV